MADISWKVERLDCAPQQGNLANVVHVVHWRCNGVEGDHTGTCYGSVGLDAPDASFVAFDDLTEAAVLTWVKTKLGADEVARIEASVAAQIATSKAPTVTYPPLPWVA